MALCRVALKAEQGAAALSRESLCGRVPASKTALAFREGLQSEPLRVRGKRLRGAVSRAPAAFRSCLTLLF